MEAVPTTLWDVWVKHMHMNVGLPIDSVTDYMRQLLSVLAYLHSKGIVHRDVKAQNILINCETGMLKLCDYSNSRLVTEPQAAVSAEVKKSMRCMTSSMGTPYTMPPELTVDGITATLGSDVMKSDIYSAGVTMCDMLTGALLFMVFEVAGLTFWWQKRHGHVPFCISKDHWKRVQSTVSDLSSDDSIAEDLTEEVSCLFSTHVYTQTIYLDMDTCLLYIHIHTHWQSTRMHTSRCTRSHRVSKLPCTRMPN